MRDFRDPLSLFSSSMMFSSLVSQSSQSFIRFWTREITHIKLALYLINNDVINILDRLVSTGSIDKLSLFPLTLTVQLTLKVVGNVPSLNKSIQKRLLKNQLICFVLTSIQRDI